MSYYIERPLNDEQSNNFLKSQGFVLVCHCSQSQWLYGSFHLTLNPNTIIRTNEELYEAIYNAGIEEGIYKEKGNVFNDLRSKLADIIFQTEVKKVDDTPYPC